MASKINDLSKFEDLGMKVIPIARTERADTKDNVVLQLNHDKKRGYISIDKVICRIAWGDDCDRVLPILDFKRSRLYLISNDKGYSLKNSEKPNSSRLSFYSQPLYFEMISHKYSRLANSDLLFDENLKAYYVEVK